MNKLTKIGLTALASTLVAGSVSAADLSVTGGAAITFGGGDDNKTTGNGWSMGDSVTFTASGDVNDIGVTVSYEMDGAENTGGLDDHSITFDLGDAGTLVFAGHGGTGVLDAWDDVTPNAYEESWDIVSGADANRTNGLTGNNSWGYTSPSMGGATFHASYFNNNTGNASVYTDFGIKVSPEAVEGLEVGYAWGTTEATAATEIDDSTVYIKYAYGPVTVGYQESESDAPTATDTDESEFFGITYAVTDSFSISLNL